jgi:hypothetical protein
LKFRWWLKDRGWPTYECEDCIGMRDHGCYCGYHGLYKPASNDVPLEGRVARWLYKLLWDDMG